MVRITGGAFEQARSALEPDIATVAASLAGATIPVAGSEGDCEAMVGTLSPYDPECERTHGIAPVVAISWDWITPSPSRESADVAGAKLRITGRKHRTPVRRFPGTSYRRRACNNAVGKSVKG
jgi:hypothetical protein